MIPIAELEPIVQAADLGHYGNGLTLSFSSI